MKKFLNITILSFVLFTFIRVSLYLSNSYLTGISLSSLSLTYSYRALILPYLMASKHYLTRRSSLVPAILSTRSSFFAKYLFFLDVSHQFFQALNFTILLSVLLSRAAYLNPRKTLYLNHKFVTKSLILSYLLFSSIFLVWASHFMKLFLWILYFFLDIIEYMKSY